MSDSYPQPAYLTLSDSSSSALHSCARLFEFRKIYRHARLSDDDADSEAPGAGKALHLAAQAFLTTGNFDDGAAALMLNYPIRFQKSPMESRSLEACYATYRALTRAPFLGRYQLASVIPEGESAPRPAVEVPFRIKLTNKFLDAENTIPIYWDGFIDAILWNAMESSQYAVVDFKSTRVNRNDYTPKFSKDPQTIPYAFVLERILNRRVDWLDTKIIALYIDIAAPKIQEIPARHNQDAIQEWATRLSRDIQDLRAMYATQRFLRNGKSCDTFRRCMYWDVCDYTTPQSIRTYLDLKFGEAEPLEESNFKPWFVINLEIQ